MVVPVVALGQAAGAAVAVVQGVVAELQSLPAAVRGFTDALNPATGERFDYAMRGLNATIGYGLEPILQSATKVVDEFAGALVEGMNALREPIGKVADVFSVALRPALEAVRNALSALSDAFEVLEPLLPLLGTAFEGMMAILNVLTTVGFYALVELIRQLVGSGQGLEGTTKALAEAFVGLAEATIRASLFLLTFANLQKSLLPALQALAREPPPRVGRQGMPQGFAISSLEEIYRKRLLAAAQAGAGRPIEEQQFDVAKQIRDLAQKILEELQKEPQGGAAQKDFEERLKEAGGRGARFGGAGVEIFPDLIRSMFDLFNRNRRNQGGP